MGCEHTSLTKVELITSLQRKIIYGFFAILCHLPGPPLPPPPLSGMFMYLSI